MWRLERLMAEHVRAVEEFERSNRHYFAASVPDRGDDYFAEFDARYRALLDEQEAGVCRFHVVVDETGKVLGRVNLVDVADGSAELGYRIAQDAAGRGLATAAVVDVSTVARDEFGLTRLTARTTLDNPGSMAVLRKAGFVGCGAVDLDGRAGRVFVKPL